MSQRYCLALDLKNDKELISQYESYHRNENIWPEITKSIKDSGITDMEIYRIENRLFMIIETVENFDFDRKAKMDTENPKVIEWENLMWRFQQPLPQSAPGEKWIKMKRIFKL